MSPIPNQPDSGAAQNPCQSRPCQDRSKCRGRLTGHGIYFSAAVRCVPGTPFLATVPSRLAGFESNNPAVRILKPPEVLGRFNYLMAWHPRMNTDAAHLWLRRAIRETAKALAVQIAAD